MKTIMLKVAFIAIALLAFHAKSDAITVQFYINITDYCSPQPYTGNYIAQITINYDGGPTLCSYITQSNPCTLGTGNNQITFPCNIEDYGAKPLYEIHVRVCRCTNPLTCCANGANYYLSFDQLSDNSQTVYVTL